MEVDTGKKQAVYFPPSQKGSGVGGFEVGHKAGSKELIGSL